MTMKWKVECQLTMPGLRNKKLGVSHCFVILLNTKGMMKDMSITFKHVELHYIFNV